MIFPYTAKRNQFRRLLREIPAYTGLSSTETLTDVINLDRDQSHAN